MKARAIETQCYVVAAAQYGQHNPNRSSYGRSVVVDPWGTLTACCSDISPTFSLTEVNQQYLRKVRESMPIFEHKRSEVYGKLNLHNVVQID